VTPSEISSVSFLVEVEFKNDDEKNGRRRPKKEVLQQWIMTSEDDQQ
jgi:hypothetical protein